MKATWSKLTLLNFFLCTFLLAQTQMQSYYSKLFLDLIQKSSHSLTNTLEPLELKVSSILGETWSGSVWSQASNRTYTYDVHGNVSEEVLQKYSGGWVNDSRTVYTYDNSNLVTLVLNYDWVSGAWANNSKIIIVYTSTTTEQTSYNWVNGAWENNQLVTITYSNNVTSSTLIKEWQIGAWVNQYQYTYTSAQGHVLTALMQMWQNNAWVNITNSTYTYTNNLLSQLVTQSWQSSAWVNAMRSTYTYDNNGNNTILLQEMWLSGQWFSSSRITATYSNNLKQVELTEVWSLISSSWSNSSRYTYTYANFTDVEKNNIPLAFGLDQNYPNPFNPTTTIKFSIPSESFVYLKVFDVIGREVAVLVNEEKIPGNYEVKLDASSLASGVYFYVIKASNYIQAKKMVLIK